MSKMETINPATETPIATYEVMDRDSAVAKVEACHAAFLDWRSKSHQERAPYLTKIAEALRNHADDLSKLMTREVGKLYRDSTSEVELCAQIFEYTAEHGPAELADETRKHSGGEKSGLVTYQPIGVIYSI